MARAARQGSAAALAEALPASLADTLATFASYERALPGCSVPLRAELNPLCGNWGTSAGSRNSGLHAIVLLAMLLAMLLLVALVDGASFAWRRWLTH